MIAPPLRFEQDALDHPAVLASLELHLREALANSPPGSVFAFDLSGLKHPTVTVWSAWDGTTLAGMGALKALNSEHGEIKSMRTAPDHRGRGVGRTMLDHLIGVARSRGYRRLSLETGTNEAFAPARRLYERAGFVLGPAFGDYALTDFNRCYTLDL